MLLILIPRTKKNQATKGILRKVTREVGEMDSLQQKCSIPNLNIMQKKNMCQMTSLMELKRKDTEWTTEQNG